MSSQDTGKEPDPHLSVLRLLTSPLRLICATVWRVVQEKDVLNYGVVEEFIASVAEAIPDLLSERQWVQLLLGLRAKVVLDSCRCESSSGAKAIQHHLDRIQLPAPPSIRGSDVKSAQSNFHDFVKVLQSDPVGKDLFFQEVFPEYEPKIDLQLRRLISRFVSRLEEFLPTSRIDQVAAMLVEVPSVMEECFQTLSHPHKLLSSISHLKSHADIDTSEDHIYGSPSPQPLGEEDCIFSFLSHPPLLQLDVGSNEIPTAAKSSFLEEDTVECEEVSSLATESYFVDDKRETELGDKTDKTVVKTEGQEDHVKRHGDHEEEKVCGSTKNDENIDQQRQLVVRLERIDITGIPLPPPLPRQSKRPRKQKLSFLQAKYEGQQISWISPIDNESDLPPKSQHSVPIAKRPKTGCQPPYVIFTCYKCSFQASSGVDLDQHLIKAHRNDLRPLHSADFRLISVAKLKPSHKASVLVKQLQIPKRRMVSKMCPKCKKTFTRGSDMRRHLKTCNVVCEEILPSQPTQEHLSVENDVTGTTSQIDQIKRVNEASVSPRSCVYSAPLQPPKTRERSVVSKTCPKCKKTFTSGSDMRRHLKTCKVVCAEILPPQQTPDLLTVEKDVTGTTSQHDQINGVNEAGVSQRSVENLQPSRVYSAPFQPPKRRERRVVSKTCPKCKKTFTSGSDMRRHLKTCKVVCDEILPPQSAPDLLTVENNVTGTTSQNDQIKRLTEAGGSQGSGAELQSNNVALASGFHIKLSGTKPLVPKTCPKCKKTFSRGYDMRKHLKICKVVSEQVLSPQPTHPLGRVIVSKICPKCGQTFQTPSAMRKHLRTHFCPKMTVPEHLKDSKECPICGKTFTIAASMLQHYNLHTDPHLEGFHCDICKEVFGSETELNKHQIGHYMLVTGLQCYICKETFAMESELVEHLHGHNPEETLRCSDCGRRCRNAVHLAIHNQVHSQEVRIKCAMCEETFRKCVPLRSHFFKAHNIKDSYPCSHCENTFTTVPELVSHIRSLCVEKRRYNCPGCSKTFSIAYSLSAHQRLSCPGLQKPEEPGHLCHLCGKVYLTAGRLRSHIKAVHVSIPPFTCDQCSRGFKTFDVLQNHLKTHLDDKERQHYACSYCDKKFVSRGTLVRHHRIHTGERPHCCKECNKTFLTDTELKKHMRYHTGHKPFKCEVCGKAFTQSCYLKVHMVAHTDARPYSCSVCEKPFKDHNHLRRHMRIHTGEKPYLCQQCGKRFIQSIQLKLHLKKCTQ